MKQFKVGLQLYSVRGDMEKDFYGTLKAVKEAGYDYVEFAGYYGHTAQEVRAMLDELVSRGYFKECAGVVFGDMGQNRSMLTGKARRRLMANMAQVRKDFAAKVTCPVYEDYPYGHVPVSYTIDFLRKKTITVDGILKQ